MGPIERIEGLRSGNSSDEQEKCPPHLQAERFFGVEEIEVS